MTQGQRPPPMNSPELLQQAIELHKVGRFEEAARLYRETLLSHPDNASALHLLGVVEAQLGHHDTAVELIGRAIEIDPANAAAHYNLGNALRELNRYEEALSAYDRSLQLRGDDPGVLNNQGAVLFALGRLEEAVAAYDRALAIDPRRAEALCNRGNALLALGKHQAALLSYDRSLALRPESVQAFIGRGAALAALKDRDRALLSYKRALGLDPTHVGAHIQCAEILVQLYRLEEALAEFDQAIVLKRDSAMSHLRRADVLRMIGRAEEAAQSYQNAFSLNPELEDVEGARLTGKMHVCDWSGIAAERTQLVASIRSGKRAATPFDFLMAGGGPKDQLLCAQAYAAARYPPSPTPLWQGERYGHRKIRLAYASGEFRDQATAFLTAGLFECHDRTAFELHAISTGLDDQGPMRRRLKSAFDVFHDVSGRPDKDIARLIRQSEIDILVNLNGFFGEERTGVVLFKPSPTQVNYLGFPGTMGAGYMDYIIADRWIIPEDEQCFYTEKVVYLPDSYQVNDFRKAIGRNLPSRSTCGLPETGFVFCCFNNAYKITPEIFDIWMRLLSRVEGSVLWLLELDAAAGRNLRREAEARGIQAHRIVLAPFLKLEDHLARGRLADLFVDTLPVNAHTTASDALWMGVPVLTCLGTTFAGRVAASLLSAVGLEELITHSLDEYESLALSLAGDPERLAQIRAKLARNRDTYPLFDTPHFTRHIEAAYQQMFERQQQGLPPAAFSVGDPTSPT